MDILLKQRLVGAIVLISLAVIFLPMLFTGYGDEEQKFESSIPAEPVYEIKSPQVSVPLPLPSKTLEKVPLREPVITDEQVAAKEEPKVAAIASERAEPAKPKTAPVKQPSSDPQDNDPQNDSQNNDSQNNVPQNNVPRNKASAAPVVMAEPTPSFTPEPEKADTAPIKASDVTGWVVQVGSFSQHANAEKLRDRLRKMGMASFVAKGMSNNKTVYRVRVGPEINRVEAEKIQAKIKEKTKLNGLVMKYP